jgi:hypothetical protein
MTRIKLRVRYRHGAMPPAVLALVLLSVGLVAAAILNPALAAAPSSPSAASAATWARQFYLTTGTSNGAQALTACAEGYHFASVWEIADPSSLKYNTSLGRLSADSGAGPPTGIPGLGVTFTVRGWVRTGYVPSTGATAGHGN